MKQRKTSKAKIKAEWLNQSEKLAYLVRASGGAGAAFLWRGRCFLPLGEVPSILGKKSVGWCLGGRDRKKRFLLNEILQIKKTLFIIKKPLFIKKERFYVKIKK